MYSTHSEGKSVVAEKSITTLKNKIYKYIISISKNVYIDKLDDIVNKQNNTYSTIKVKPVNVKLNIYISNGINGTEFKISDIVRISKHKNIFAEGHVSNWSEEVFVIKKFKNSAVDIFY